MRTLTITLNLDNAAFFEPGELARILKHIADSHWPHTAYSRTVRDLNGNRCGTAVYAMVKPTHGGDCPHCGSTLHRADELDECGFEQVVCEECERSFTIEPEDE